MRHYFSKPIMPHKTKNKEFSFTSKKAISGLFANILILYILYLGKFISGAIFSAVNKCEQLHPYQPAPNLSLPLNLSTGSRSIWVPGILQQDWDCRRHGCSWKTS